MVEGVGDRGKRGYGNKRTVGGKEREGEPVFFSTGKGRPDMGAPLLSGRPSTLAQRRVTAK